MRQILSNQFEHRATQDDGVAQVAHAQVAQPHPVLHQQGLVQAVARDQGGFLFRRGTDLNHVVDRIPGNPVDDQENDHRHRQKNGDQQQQPPEAIVQQTGTPCAGSNAARPAAGTERLLYLTSISMMDWVAIFMPRMVSGSFRRVWL